VRLCSQLYRSRVRSKFDYGCVVYGSVRQSVLESLAFVHICRVVHLYSSIHNVTGCKSTCGSG